MFELSIEADVARVTLRRPDVRNAIPLSGWDELEARLAEVEASPARLLIVEGTGAAFCAGADLGEFTIFRNNEAARSRFRLAMRGALDALAGLPMPTVALVEGSCYGAGVALAMACDIRLAGPQARFAITPAKMGISFPQEDVYRLVGLAGAGAASRLLLAGGSIDSAEAVRIGLADGLAGEAEALIAAILANDSASLATLKRSVSLAVQGVRSDSRQDEAFDSLLGSEALARRLAERSAR
ncbi:enoyl-CoA hydratase/isomerase family protein [Allosphingosinicella sp.]|jgi:enoyl-CoA hydratase/carnithine racemase|uniref:enoyl-CoA hydratase/isomerase family protein n=1 Tax=Allosphingosinicella sp. TaxID=2823234 RepID=UPI002EEF2BCD